MPEIKIPFPGLYHSWLSNMLDDAENREIEYRAEDEHDSTKWPAELRVADEISEAWMGAMSYPAAHENLARLYLDRFDDWAGEALGETRPVWVRRYDFATRKSKRVRVAGDSCGFKFSAMTSPRAYNFETDRLFATCSAAFIKRLWKRSKADDHKTLATVIRDRFTSYDGFCSHYADDLDNWPKSLAEWDHNELETLLIACLQLAGADDTGFRDLMFEEHETVAEIVSSAMDWGNFERRLMDARITRLIAWAETDPDAVADWAAQNPDAWAKLRAHDAGEVDTLDLPLRAAIEFHYRCPATPDLFA